MSDQPEDSMSMNRLKRRRISGISYKLRGGGQFRNLPRRVGPGCAHDLALCDASLPAGDTAFSSAKEPRWTVAKLKPVLLATNANMPSTFAHKCSITS